MSDEALPLVCFPAGGLYREAMFAQLEREGRRWFVAFSGSSLQSVVAAVAGKAIRVTGFRLRAASAATASFLNGSAGASRSGVLRLPANGGIDLGFATQGYFQTNPGVALVVTTSAAITGLLTYTLV